MPSASTAIPNVVPMTGVYSAYMGSCSPTTTPAREGPFRRRARGAVVVLARVAGVERVARVAQVPA